jgi:hypothetical protein
MCSACGSFAAPSAAGQVTATIRYSFPAAPLFHTIVLFVLFCWLLSVMRTALVDRMPQTCPVCALGGLGADASGVSFRG